MSLYLIKTDGCDEIYVEAENFSRALVVWHTWARAEYGDDYHENDQPMSVELVSEGIVWRDDAMDTAEIELEVLRKKNERGAARSVSIHGETMMPTNDEIDAALEGWEFWRKYLSEHAPQSVVRERGEDLAHLLREVMRERRDAAAALLAPGGAEEMRYCMLCGRETPHAPMPNPNPPTSTATFLPALGEMARPCCGLCGELMPPGEEMFQFHGASGPCPKNPLPITPSPVPEAVRVDRLAHTADSDAAEMRDAAAALRSTANCPECGKPGKHEATTADGTVLWRYHSCVRQGIGLGDVRYEYSMIFDKDGGKYV